MVMCPPLQPLAAVLEVDGWVHAAAAAALLHILIVLCWLSSGFPADLQNPMAVPVVQCPHTNPRILRSPAASVCAAVHLCQHHSTVSRGAVRRSHVEHHSADAWAVALRP